VYYKSSQSAVKQQTMVSVLKPVTKTSPASTVATMSPKQQQPARVIRAKSATSAEAPLGLNLGDVDLEKLSDTLEQVADFDQMFKQLTECQSSLENPTSMDMVSGIDSVVTVKQENGSTKRKLNSSVQSTITTGLSSPKKVKHEDNVKNVNINITMNEANTPDILTTPDPLECGYLFDFDDGFNSPALVKSESGYSSDTPFSPESSDLPSPKIPETTSAWEESFTELFPSLM